MLSVIDSDHTSRQRKQVKFSVRRLWRDVHNITDGRTGHNVQSQHTGQYLFHQLPLTSDKAGDASIIASTPRHPRQWIYR